MSSESKIPTASSSFVRPLRSQLRLFALFAIPVLCVWRFELLQSLRPAFPPLPDLAAHCSNVKPIKADEFHQRQTRLAVALNALNASAYIAEPGASTQFFVNISGADWHLSERPLLLVVAPEFVNGAVRARLSIVTPMFEATRARLLPLAVTSNISFVEWAEDVDPYEVTMALLPALNSSGSVAYVDGSIRKFIVDGLADAAPKTTLMSAPLAIRQLRERKSPDEIDIMRCANEVTLLAIRAVRDQMFVGIRESQTRELMVKALTAGNLLNGHCLVLFGENAALPHGSGTDRALRKSEMALFDCGGTLHGYTSDITRTIALPGSTIASEHLEVWFAVHTAQRSAAQAARSGAITADVDGAARGVIEALGYGKYFTHRLGHGIGLEGHEAPYLRGGSADIIRPGHTFSNEPGVYIEGDVGVRLEDIFYIANDGASVFLTEGVGGPATSPWKP